MPHWAVGACFELHKHTPCVQAVRPDCVPRCGSAVVLHASQSSSVRRYSGMLQTAVDSKCMHRDAGVPFDTGELAKRRQHASLVQDIRVNQAQPTFSQGLSLAWHRLRCAASGAAGLLRTAIALSDGQRAHEDNDEYFSCAVADFSALSHPCASHHTHFGEHRRPSEALPKRCRKRYRCTGKSRYAALLTA